MTTDRHLNLMALMREIEAPTKAYQRSVRLAAALGSETPQWDAAVERGTTALDHIDCAVRRWVTAHPEPSTLPAGFERRTGVAVKCAACGYGFDEDEFIHFFDSPEEARDTVVGTGWDELKDGRVVCETRDEKHNELRATVPAAVETGE